MTHYIFISLGLIAGLYAFLSPVNSVFILVVFTFFISGLMLFFLPQYAMITWSVTVMSSMLLLMGLFLAATNGKKMKLPSPLLFMVLFFLTVILGGMLNLNLAEFFVSSKNYFQFWSIPLVLFYASVQERDVSKLAKLFIAITIFQVLMATYQYIEFRNELFSGDRISGTFNSVYGSPGGSGEMAIYLTVMVGLVIALYKYKLLSIIKMTIAIAILSVALMFTHAKIVVLLLPITYFLVYGRAVFRNAGKFLLSMILISGMLLSIVFYYFNTSNQYTESDVRTQTYEQFVEKAFSYNIESNQRGKLTRISGITFWFKENLENDNIVEILFGHGLGAVKEDSGVLRGHLVDKMPYAGIGLGLTSMSRLLWETGFIGCGLYIMIFFSAFRLASKLEVSAYMSDSERAFVAASRSACVLFILSMIYNVGLINNQPFNAFSMFIIAYIVYAYKKVDERRKNTVVTDDATTVSKTSVLKTRSRILHHVG